MSSPTSTTVSSADSAPEAPRTDAGEEHASPALQVPLLVAGLPGTGKTSELATQALAHAWHDMATGVPPRRTLCLAAHNSAVIVLQAKMTKGARMLDQTAMEALRRQQRDEGADGSSSSSSSSSRSLQQKTCSTTPSQQPGWLAPQFDTIHHACRRWLSKYGHLIGQHNMGDVCSEQRALHILSTLQSEQVVDVFDEREDVDMQGLQDNVQNITAATLRDSLSIVAPDEVFLSAAVRCAQRCRQLQVTAVMLQDIFSKLKSNHFDVNDELRDRYSEPALDAAGEMRGFYDALLRHNRLYDFDDLVVYGLQLVQGFARHIVDAEKIGLIVLDDVHNTSVSQREFVRALAGESGTNGRLLVACEEMRLSPSFYDAEPSDMSTFRFSGAPAQINAHDLMQECLAHGQGYAPLALTANTRSSAMIRHVAYEMMAHHVVEQNDRLKRPYLCAFASIREEASFVCEETEQIHFEDDVKERELSSIAIIARRNEEVRFLVDELVNLGRAVRVMGQENGDLSSDEALDLVSFLAAAQNPYLHHLVDRALVVFRRCSNQPELTINDLPDANDMAAYLSGGDEAVSDTAKPFLDVLRDVERDVGHHGREIGATLRRLVDVLAYKERYLGQPPAADADDADVIRPVRHSTGTRWECVQALLRRADDFDDRFAMGHTGRRADMFLRECHAYAGDRLGYRRSRPQGDITLLTMHYAHAMEFDVVFISSLERDSMPRRAFGGAETSGERKLLFLTILRARQRVYFHYLDQAHANAARANRRDDDDDGSSSSDDKEERALTRQLLHNATIQRAPGGHSVFLNPILITLRRR